jgi:uncharacterized membrane protein
MVGILFIGFSLVGGGLFYYQLQNFLKKRSMVAAQNAWNHGGIRTTNPTPIAIGSSLVSEIHLNPFQNPGLSKEDKIISARKALQVDEHVANIAVCGNSGTGKCVFKNFEHIL